MKILINDVDAFIFDFDGVLTNNQVYVNQSGEELVACSRSDGLAFDVLKKIKKPAFILSTEQNPVVSMRAKKLKIKVMQGVADKEKAIKDLAFKNNFSLENILYIGNDLNDYLAMKVCGFSVCPIDSHPKIKEISKHVLNTRGGNGVIRELLEEVFDLNFITILYSKKEAKR